MWRNILRRSTPERSSDGQKLCTQLDTFHFIPVTQSSPSWFFFSMLRLQRADKAKHLKDFFVWSRQRSMPSAFKLLQQVCPNLFHHKWATHPSNSALRFIVLAMGKRDSRFILGYLFKRCKTIKLLNWNDPKKAQENKQLFQVHVRLLILGLLEILMRWYEILVNFLSMDSNVLWEMGNIFKNLAAFLCL